MVKKIAVHKAFGRVISSPAIVRVVKELS